MPRLIKLFTCTVTDWWAQADDEGGALYFTVDTDLGNTKRVCVPHKTIAVGGPELYGTLAMQGVRIHPPGKQYIQEFLMALLTQLQTLQKSTICLPYGWWLGPDGNRHGFVYGGRIIKDDGTDHPSGLGDPRLHLIYSPTGALQPWLAACRLVTDMKRPELDAIIAAGFAAPLLVVPAEYTCLLSAYGEGGAGKSTAAKIMQAIWAHPKKAKEIDMTTARSAIAKLGEIKNLPLLYDDVKNEQGQKQVLNVIYGTEGIGPGRLTSNIVQRDRPDWQTVIVMCSNISFVDHIIKENRANEAGMYRTFEYLVKKSNPGDPGVISEVDMSRATQLLEQNYGVVGMMYAKLLGSDPAAVDRLVLNEVRSFNTEVQAIPQERFWSKLCGILIAGAHYANHFGAQIDIPALRKFLVDTYTKQRQRMITEATRGGDTDNTQGFLTSFLKKYIENAVYTDTCPMGAGKPKAVSLIAGPPIDRPRSIYVQWAVDSRILRIDRSQFKDYLNALKVSPHQVMTGLKEHFNMKEVNATLAANTPLRCGQEWLLQIPVPPGSPLEDQMNAHNQPKPGDQPSTIPMERPGGIIAATAQAAKDLALVRDKT